MLQARIGLATTIILILCCEVSGSVTRLLSRESLTYSAQLLRGSVRIGIEQLYRLHRVN